ncbi:ATP-binding cassette domain-containing protein [Paenibacillus sp. MER 99-2]|uniref:ATP-binding cassette domain-containing protein n=1 Tax=Paenibacillus sp. MER 99-2 TaxID=2939572 RepID=UPI002041E6B9|nr:ATP-binding cassette domain-containing protein [Paenibacillus sp. MER 99-2]MCM3172454.1 ATP-binding cassette domain-containing protein [Paenibacillus sp. MER 99-2]
MQDVTSLITLDNVRVYYALSPDKVQKAVDGVSLHIHKGEWISIVGANGSGKSTIAGLLIGFTPLSGGSRMVKPDVTIRGVLQHPDAQVLGDTIEEEFHFALSSLSVSAEEKQKRREEALHTVGLRKSPDAAISRLSGGQKQLLNIAVALAAKPDILVLDEPTAMLDPGARERIESIVENIIQQGTAVIWITHHLEEATLCDRIIAMDKGGCVYDGDPVAFFYTPKVEGDVSRNVESESICRQLGLDPPFTVKTAYILKQKGLLLQATPLRPEQLVREVNS